MLWNSYLGAFSRQLKPGYNPPSVQIPGSPGVFAALPYGNEPIARPQAARTLKGQEKITRLGSYQYFREQL